MQNLTAKKRRLKVHSRMKSNMHEETAKKIVELMCSASEDLNDSIVIVRETEADSTSGRHAEIVSKLMFSILTEILNPLMAEHPHLIPEQLESSRAWLTSQK